MTITGIVINGMDPQDFSQQNNCPASLPVNGSCQIQVTFTPTMAGSRTASPSVSYQGHGSPQTISLGGVGLAAATVSFDSVEFDISRSANPHGKQAANSNANQYWDGRCADIQHLDCDAIQPDE